MKFSIEILVLELAQEVLCELSSGEDLEESLESSIEAMLRYLASIEEEPARAYVKILLGAGPLPREDVVARLTPYGAG